MHRAKTASIKFMKFIKMQRSIVFVLKASTGSLLLALSALCHYQHKLQQYLPNLKTQWQCCLLGKLDEVNVFAWFSSKRWLRFVHRNSWRKICWHRFKLLCTVCTLFPCVCLFTKLNSTWKFNKCIKLIVYDIL